jgi:hypothetical protein
MGGAGGGWIEERVAGRPRKVRRQSDRQQN